MDTAGFVVAVLATLRLTAAQLGQGIPQPLYYSYPVRYFSGRYFTTGECSEYARHLLVQVDQMTVPTTPDGTGKVQAYALSSLSTQGSGLGPEADVLFFNFETGQAIIGQPIYGPDDYYNDYPSPYTYNPFASVINWTFVGPFEAGADTNEPSVRLYLSALLRAQYYALMIAYGPLGPVSNAWACVSGSAWEMQSTVSYFSSLLRSILPGVVVLDGVPLRQQLIAAEPQVNSALPLGLLEANALYRLDSVFTPHDHTAKTAEACAQACSEDYLCGAWAFCNALQGCLYPSAPLPSASDSTISLLTQPDTPAPQLQAEQAQEDNYSASALPLLTFSDPSATPDPSVLPELAAAPQKLGTFPAPLSARSFAAPGGVNANIRQIGAYGSLPTYGYTYAPPPYYYYSYPPPPYGYGPSPGPSPPTSSPMPAPAGEEHRYQACLLSRWTSHASSPGTVLARGPDVPWTSGRISIPRPLHADTSFGLN